ncbi:hypothetical protein [Thiocapsa bogorovii]|uniref:hypothetical protein n=1 Tax=Thiocapsa bogorovii TaxID=521689 RepID=UPI001E4CCF5F|nr:hypothetical protein [Thiocapsa bogorovii]UHD15744.1 hypothetical protein LT988_21185 [Thiocapsa bogorovii]
MMTGSGIGANLGECCGAEIPKPSDINEVVVVVIVVASIVDDDNGVVHSTGRSVDERKQSPPNPATALVDCASLVHPTALV